jgi:HD-GYP domain-containing protein (c-di-GMP phosphodiesterase class II)
MRQYILGLVGPAKAYEIIGKYAYIFTKSATYESKKIGNNKIEITVSPKEGVKEKPFQCENRMGYWEAIALIFNYKLPKVEHSECLFKGGKACRYEVSWRESKADFWKRARNYIAFFFAAICLGLYPKYSELTLSIILPSCVFVILLLTIYAGTLVKRELSASIDILMDSSDRLVEQINVNYNNNLLVNEIGLTLGKQTDIGGILNKVMQVLEKRLDYDRGIIFLANKDKTKLNFSAGFGYNDKQLELLRNINFHLDRPESKGVFVVSFRENKQFLINDIDEIRTDLSPRSLEFAKKMGTKSFICCPIVREEESLGVLAVDNIKTKRPLVQSDISLLMGLTPAIGISIHNAMLIGMRERQFKSILQVLASSIDARDPLTAGHSEKVTNYALGICGELGLSKEYSEMIRVASLLHDYGKIGIQDDILKKKGLLTAEEREEIKSHVEKTRRILEQINFEGIYREVPEVTGAHHEKFDGSGYPKGLRGEEIPLGARIIAVADVFEAITSKRHYRDPMHLDVAFKLLNEGSGNDFDGEVVEAFIRHYYKEYSKGVKPALQSESSNVN